MLQAVAAPAPAASKAQASSGNGKFQIKMTGVGDASARVAPAPAPSTAAVTKAMEEFDPFASAPAAQAPARTYACNARVIVFHFCQQVNSVPVIISVRENGRT